MVNKLRFHARGSALVQNFEHLEAGKKSFLGRRYTQLAAPDTNDPEDFGTWGFAPTGSVAEVPYRAEYVKACKDGDLWPADEETAKACGVAFDPHFGEPTAHDTEWPAADHAAA